MRPELPKTSIVVRSEFHTRGTSPLAAGKCCYITLVQTPKVKKYVVLRVSESTAAIRLRIKE
jgi:hypothetical protein